MEKRGSRYLRYALYNATKYVCHWDPAFAAYLAKKRAEGKHYNVALSHAAKKLVRLIFALDKSGQSYCPATCSVLAFPFGGLLTLCFAIPFFNRLTFFLYPSCWGLTSNS